MTIDKISFPPFLPSSIRQLREPEMVAIARDIRRIPIATPLSSRPIQTAHVRRDRGAVPTVFLHGFDSSFLEFSRLVPHLKLSDIWLLDLIGFGFSDRIPNLSYSPQALKTHLYHCWKTLIKKPMILVGASMGGAAAIDFTLTHPEAVQKLILIDSVGYNGGFELGQFLVYPFDDVAVEFWRQRKLTGLNFGSFFGINSRDIEAMRCVCVHMDMPGWKEAIASFTRSGGYFNLRDRISQIDKPTLILWGDRDETLGTEDAIAFKRDIAGSRLEWIANCGHAPHLEKPEITAKLIDEFIGCDR
ncbi:alpha/beta hydrolase [Lyngbya sp. CCY1209]|uniref:alpha/beta fold hydrolase n=1 Tax=Lyngbya sp. CCY1209 TaxID=2886103 RepID=UPI002D20BE33|nr:alpha/beta hydrolase [Lyngbya sp. CCY1209]MEB3882518.1 alpha/beta hydrolase [Lyngbya sp. CCY1209]